VAKRQIRMYGVGILTPNHWNSYAKM